jgi:hypothetical protein
MSDAPTPPEQLRLLDEASALPNERGTIVFSSLVDAYFEHHRFHKSAAAEYKAYATRRLELLEEAFGVSFLDKLLRARHSFLRREGSSRVLDRDQYQAIQLARRSLERYAKLFSPFGSYLEGGPGPIEQALWDRHGREFSDLNEKLRERYRALFADCLLAFHPDAAEMSTTETWLREQGLSERPDEDLLF